MQHMCPSISIQNCALFRGDSRVLAPFSWQLNPGETWLVTGPNGGGKSLFVEALGGGCRSDGRGEQAASKLHFEPQGEVALYFNMFTESTALVSLEAAAALIAQERANDESDYVEGGVDIGRTARRFICEVLSPDDSGAEGVGLESLPEVELCGVASVLDRGLKYLSTGEIRRVLLCRALLSKRKLLILSDPFAGLDVASREILGNFFSTMAMSSEGQPTVLLCMERLTELPQGISNVIEFSGGELSFCGDISTFKDIVAGKADISSKVAAAEKSLVAQTFHGLHEERKLVSGDVFRMRIEPAVDVGANDMPAELVRMRDVTVAWGDHTVLDNLSWTLHEGEHWLIRGPNGSGKTTFLELITGDNMQVFCNDVSIFGHRRGTGETVWELKEKMGIVSYRLHLEYRMLGGTDLEAVLISGLHDSIGLYQQRSDVEQASVRKWLAFGGFAGREHEAFGTLSYGEQRAILILRAVVKCPQLLILDEPCHGLDELHRTRILNLLEAIAETGSTTLLHVTHDSTEVLPCEKHILELRPGETPMYRILVEP